MEDIIKVGDIIHLKGCGKIAWRVEAVRPKTVWITNATSGAGIDPKTSTRVYKTKITAVFDGGKGAPQSSF